MGHKLPLEKPQSYRTLISKLTNNRFKFAPKTATGWNRVDDPG